MSPRKIAEGTFNFTAANTPADLVSTLKDMSQGPMAHFALQVKATGFTAWIVLLEGTINGTDWFTLLTHTEAVPATGQAVWTTAQKACKKVRMNCTSATGAGSLASSFLGVPI